MAKKKASKKKKKTPEEVYAAHVKNMETQVKIITDAATELNEFRHAQGYKFDGNRITEVMSSIESLTDLRSDVDDAIGAILKEMQFEIVNQQRQQTATLKKAGLIPRRKRAKKKPSSDPAPAGEAADNSSE